MPHPPAHTVRRPVPPQASVIALANNTLPLAQLLTGLFAGAFVQRFLPHRPGGSSSRGGGEEAVGSLFLYGGAAIGGSEALLLLLLRLYGGGFWRGEQPSEVAGRERGGGAGSTARTTESPDMRNLSDFGGCERGAESESVGAAAQRADEHIQVGGNY